MSKYARFVDLSDAQDGSDIRTIDVVDMAAYAPLPNWYTTNDTFLERIFSPQLVAQWKVNGHWFVAVPSSVVAGARFIGSDRNDSLAYVNPDRADGNGLTLQHVAAAN